jgi:predicted HAD superfamily phosphohydrolase YqeG
VTARYETLTDEADVPRLVGALSARTVIVDIEPLIAVWDSGRDALDQGIARFLDRVRAIESVAVVCFATNSARVPSAVPEAPGVMIEYLASARKPLRTAPYRKMPLPGVVIGDQLATDGVLARRMGYAFLHYRPKLEEMPPGPRVLSRGGQMLRPLLFPGSSAGALLPGRPIAGSAGRLRAARGLPGAFLRLAGRL